MICCFLAIDITEEDAVDNWIENIEKRATSHDLGGSRWKNWSGHGSLIHEEQVWTRHIGGMILLLAPETRGKGLGNILAGRTFLVMRKN